MSHIHGITRMSSRVALGSPVACEMEYDEGFDAYRIYLATHSRTELVELIDRLIAELTFMRADCMIRPTVRG